MKKLFATLSMLGLLLWGAGCSNQTTEPEATDGLNFIDEFGGYSATSESPGFGDSQLMNDEFDDVEINDPIQFSPAVDSIASDPESGIFMFRAVWGRLRPDTTITEQTDWTGALTITRGAEVVRHLINFEDGQDFLIERSNHKVVEWVSFTSRHNDGIAVQLFVPPPHPELDTMFVPDSQGNDSMVVDTIWPDPVTVTFRTGPYSQTFNLEELAALDTVIRLDDGNAVAFSALRIPRFECPRGFTMGHWGSDDEGRTVFRGRWYNVEGRLIGYMGGHAGINDDGRRVMFGKWISRNGSFEGFLRGTWGPNEDPNLTDLSDGWFTGGIFNGNRVMVGKFMGHYQEADEMHLGFFKGRWKIECPAICHEGHTGDMDNLSDGF